MEPETEDKALPELSEAQTLPLSGAAVKEGIAADHRGTHHHAYHIRENRK